MPKQKVVAVLLFLVLAVSAHAELTIKAIAANGNHSLALDSDGTVWEWGGKWSAPIRVGGLTGIVSVAAGFDYGLAVRNDGTLWAWGANAVGQLGDGTTTSRPTPVQVTGLTGVIGVAACRLWEGAGDYCLYSSMALRGDGTVWQWGAMSDHVEATPTQVAGLAGVVAVSEFTALKTDGTVWIWPASSGPVQVKGLAGIVAIAGGMALKHDGTVWHWKSGAGERLSGIDGVAEISVGGLHYLAVKRDGTVWSWSADPFFSKGNQFGQLGDGTTEIRTTPGQVSGLADVVSAAAGGLHSLALKSDGTLWAWGFDGQGQLGDGRPTWRSAPGQVRGLHEVTGISAGRGSSWESTGSNSYAVKNDGVVWAWGQTEMYDKYRPMPEPVVVGLSGAVALAPRLVLKDDGTVWTWRIWRWPWAPDSEQPEQSVQISGIEDAVAIAPGVALKDDGTVWALANPPVRAQGLERIVGIASAGLENLAVREDGTVWEWLPWPPGFYSSSVTAQVSELDMVVGIAAGSYSSTCPRGPSLGFVQFCRLQTQSLAVKADGTIWAWEFSEDILPPGKKRNISRTTPVQVSGLTGIARVVAGGRHNLALKADGTVWAWGNNDSGQLGDGTTTTRTTPVQLAALTGVVGIAASTTHSLALRSDGTVWAWGQNDSGQLGDGRAIIRTTPVQVIQPGSPDLSIEMSHDGDFVAGAQGIYTLSITNTGLTPTAGMVTVTDTLPRGLTYVSAIGSGWTCSTADQVVSCTNPGPIDSGASTPTTLSVRVGLSAWPGVTNLATVSNDSDLNIANNSIGDPTVVLPPPLK